MPRFLLRPAVFVILSASWLAGQSLSEDQIVRGAADRIEKYRKGNVVLRLVDSSGKALAPGQSVQVVEQRHQFLFGANLFGMGKIDSPALESAYQQKFADLLNYATLPFYWRMFEPEKGHPKYEEAKKKAEWCQRHGITAKGHPLAWNLKDPDWLPVDINPVRQLLFERVAECVRQFQGQIDYWDVVNELTDYDRRTMRADAPHQTELIDRMGPVPYAKALFQIARENNPHAVLLMNDYLTGPRYAELLAKVTNASGQPAFDAVGIQSHQHTGVWDAQKIWNVCERFAALGRPLHFTEATIVSGALQGPLGPPKANWNTTPEGERAQAEQVVRFYTILFSHPAVEAITWWDLSDLDAWKGAPAGLLRRDMTPKPAYTVLLDLIKNQWWTRAVATTGANGEVRVRPFYGTYKVSVKQGGKDMSGTFSFPRPTGQPIEVHIQ